MNLRDHDQPCEHAPHGATHDMFLTGHAANHRWCPGGREVNVDYKAAHFMLRALYREIESVESKQRADAVVDAALGGSDE